MKLLVFTQKVDQSDSDLGFFCIWLEEMAKQVDSLIVICLQRGSYNLPENVKVYSLGKEDKVFWISYVINFYRFILKHRKEYDGVFIHMNPEYAILGGVLWRIWRKRILLWYTHKAVNLRLRLAEKLVNKIFTASKESFRLRSKKVSVVGHGIPVDRIVVREPRQPINSVRLVWVGRISSVKDLETAILAMHELKTRGVDVTLDIVGETVTEVDIEYRKTLVELIHNAHLESVVHMTGAVNFSQLFKIYSSYDIFIHTSRTGSLDKVCLEALAAGLQVVSSSEAILNLGSFIYNFPAHDSQKLAQSIEKIIESGILEQSFNEGNSLVKNNFDLHLLIEKIISYFKI